MSNTLFETLSAGCISLEADMIIAATVRLVPTGRLVLASSQSIEDQVLTHILCGATPSPRIFTLDTGRLFPETYETMERTMNRYGFRYELYTPDRRALEAMLAEHGPNLFYQSSTLRHACCSIRKVEPLRRALSTADAWICGLRQGQAVTRTALSPVEWDKANNIIKINPLWNWTGDAVRTFIRERKIPYNPLQDQGFPSIGCQPCTRAVGPDEDIRSGRWWWEAPEHRECGLHRRTTYVSRDRV